MEQLLIEGVALFTGASGHKYVAANVFVHDLAVRRHAAEGYVHIAVELNGHLEEHGKGGGQ